MGRQQPGKGSGLRFLAKPSCPEEDRRRKGRSSRYGEIVSSLVVEYTESIVRRDTRSSGIVWPPDYLVMSNAEQHEYTSGLKAEYIERDNDLLLETEKQNDEYVAGSRVNYNLPLLTIGTDFQKAVWEELMQVRYGETASYQQLAERQGRPNAVRAVAAPNSAIARSLVIPCQRIVGRSGELVGYGGGLEKATLESGKKTLDILREQQW